MEECPYCGKWTLFYDPKAEMKVCMTCGYQKKIKYELFIKQSNIIDSLRYPNHKCTKLLKVEG